MSNTRVVELWDNDGNMVAMHVRSAEEMQGVEVVKYKRHFYTIVDIHTKRGQLVEKYERVRIFQLDVKL